MRPLARHTKDPIRPGVPTVKDFLGNLALGLDFISKAGAQLVEMKKDDFDVYDRILAECDWLTREMLECIHKVGEKVLHPKLLLMPQHVFDRVAKLPYAEQELAVTLPVKVPAPVEGYRRAEERKPASALSRSEAARVWPSVARPNPLPPSPKFTLYTEMAMMDDMGDGKEYLDVSVIKATTNAKAQVIWLDENGEAVVQFCKRPKHS